MEDANGAQPDSFYSVPTQSQRTGSLVSGNWTLVSGTPEFRHRHDNRPGETLPYFITLLPLGAENETPNAGCCMRGLLSDQSPQT